MGAEASKAPLSKCVLVSPSQSENESGVYINSNRLKENFGEPITTFQTLSSAETLTEIVDFCTLKYGDSPCMGERQQFCDGSHGCYNWITYSEFRSMCVNFSIGIKSLGIARGDKIGLFMKSSYQWQVAQFGSIYAGCIPVAISDSLRHYIKDIIKDSNCKAIIIDGTSRIEQDLFDDEVFRNILKITVCKMPRLCNSFTLNHVIKLGQENKNYDEKIEVKSNDCALIMYKLGNSSVPKGCVLTHRSIISGAACLCAIGSSVTQRDSYFSYLPLAHIFEYCTELIMFVQGVKIGYFHGDVKDIYSDIKELQPTIMCGVPRFFNNLYDIIMNIIQQKPFIIRSFFNLAIKLKNSSLINDEPYSFFLDVTLFDQFKEILGGRIKLLICGGAPLISEVHDVLRTVITPNIIVGYGLTETCASGCVQEVGAQFNNSVGTVSMSMDMKFRAVEGMNYNPRNVLPSGELMFRGPPLFSGYYLDEKDTNECMIDGWFATGDIGILDSNGHVQIIDRINQAFKLSNGEFISVSNLQSIYSKCSCVKSIFVYSDSHHNYPVAVVVPTKSCIKDWLERLGITSFTDSVITKKEMLAILEERAKSLNLRSSEYIGDIILEKDDFSELIADKKDSSLPFNRELIKKYESKLIDLYRTNNTKK